MRSARISIYIKDEKNRKVLEQVESCKHIPKLGTELGHFPFKGGKEGQDTYIMKFIISPFAAAKGLAKEKKKKKNRPTGIHYLASCTEYALLYSNIFF